MRDLIYARLPLLYGVYVEVFGGAGWVLFGMESICGTEVYNDFNSNLVNLFRCVKERPLAFLLELGFLPLTSRDEFKLLKRFLKRKQFHESYLKQELDIAKKVMGNVITQKTYVKDFLTHKQEKNRGEIPQHLIEKNHEPIIAPEVFRRVQEMKGLVLSQTFEPAML